MSKSGINLSMVQDYLKDVQYPCEKQELIEMAEDLDAPDDVLEVLEMMPDREYQSAGDVAKGIGNIH